jgi:hypothetical protein
MMKNIPKQYIFYAIALIVLLIIVFQVGGALADGIRSLFGIESDDVVVPPSQVEIDAPDLSETEKQTAKRLAVAAHEDMSGLAWSRDMDLWREIISLPDELLVAVYNYFNALYYPEKDGTMYQWLMDEWGWQDPQGIASRDQVATRFQTLNLL